MSHLFGDTATDERARKNAAHGPWFIYGRTEQYESDRLNVHEDRVKKPDGSDGVYATVTLKPGVAVLQSTPTARCI